MDVCWHSTLNAQNPKLRSPARLRGRQSGSRDLGRPAPTWVPARCNPAGSQRISLKIDPHPHRQTDPPYCPRPSRPTSSDRPSLRRPTPTSPDYPQSAPNCPQTRSKPLTASINSEISAQNPANPRINVPNTSPNCDNVPKSPPRCVYM